MLIDVAFPAVIYWEQIIMQSYGLISLQLLLLEQCGFETFRQEGQHCTNCVREAGKEYQLQIADMYAMITEKGGCTYGTSSFFIISPFAALNNTVH